VDTARLRGKGVRGGKMKRRTPWMSLWVEGGSRGQVHRVRTNQRNGSSDFNREKKTQERVGRG